MRIGGRHEDEGDDYGDDDFYEHDIEHMINAGLFPLEDENEGGEEEPSSYIFH